MSLYISSLNSGSNGNCYYVGDERDAVLIDAGISCRETEKRMKRSGLSIDRVRAVFISHEHSDHISGLRVLAKKYQLPVYVTAETGKYLNLGRDPYSIHFLRPFEHVQIGGISVTPFPKAHDASDPHSFLVASATIKVGVFTDIGVVCDQLIHHFKQCHAVFLESNYDEEMLEKGNYPWHLKNRIRGGKGHLSNRQAYELVLAHRPPFMSHLLLSHLSKNNNCPDLVRKLFSQFEAQMEVVVASRYNETAVYNISENSLTGIHLDRTVANPGQYQLTLF